MPQRRGAKHRKGGKKQRKMRIHRAPRTNSLPYEEFLTFTFNKRNNINNVGVNNGCFSFRASDPQFVDFPQIGTSVNLPYHSSVKERYRQQRLVSASILVTFANKEAFPVCCVIVPVNLAVAQNDGAFDTLYFDQPNALRKFVGPLTGNGICTLRQRQTTSKFAGAPDLRVPDTYTGATDSAGVRPTNFWYFVVGVSANSVFTALGVDVDVRINMTLRCFEPAPSNS